MYVNRRRKHLSPYNRARAIYRALIMSYDSLPVMQLSLHATACVRYDACYSSILKVILGSYYSVTVNEARNMNNVQLRLS